MALVRSPIKMIATDADNTLWSGVIGEDGHVGIRVEPGHAALHKMLVGQNEAGCLLCLLSKNEESDIRKVFRHDKMAGLDWSHWAAVRVDWRSEEHTSELQSLLRTSYAVFSLKQT